MIAPVVLAEAPLRISLGGGGTDLPVYYQQFGGYVVSTAINQYCRVVAREPKDRTFRLVSADYGVDLQFPPGTIPPVAEPLALPRAALAHFADCGLRRRGIHLSLAAGVPPGTGLGSSSAMAVALVFALSAYTGRPVDAAGAAQLACTLEIERLGMPIGKQDQYASAFGGLNSITFESAGVRVQPLPLSPGIRTALDANLLLFSTGASHHSGEILGRQRNETASGGAIVERLHTLKELAHSMEAALLAGNLDEFGRLLHHSWCTKRQTSGGVSNGAIDAAYECARAAGALGGKITGAGGGGFLLLYCRPEQQAAVRMAMSRRGFPELPFAFSLRGAVVSGVERRLAALLPREHARHRPWGADRVEIGQ